VYIENGKEKLHGNERKGWICMEWTGLELSQTQIMIMMKRVLLLWTIFEIGEFFVLY